SHRFVGPAEVVRRHLARRREPGSLSTREGGHRLPRREVKQVERSAFVGGEREVALDHQALGYRGIAAEAQLGRDGSFVDLTAPRERRLLAVQRERPARDGAVL